MRKDDLVRIRHMLDAAREATEFAKDRERADLDSNRMLALSIIKSIEIVGEAASKITQVVRDAHPEIPWADIVATRKGLSTFISISTSTWCEGVVIEIPSENIYLRELKC